MRVSCNSILCPGPRRIPPGRALAFAVLGFVLILGGPACWAGTITVSAPWVLLVEGSKGQIVFEVENTDTVNPAYLHQRTRVPNDLFPEGVNRFPQNGTQNKGDNGYYGWKVTRKGPDYEDWANASQLRPFGTSQVPATLAAGGKFEIKFDLTTDLVGPLTERHDTGVTEILLVVPWSYSRVGDPSFSGNTGAVTVTDEPEPATLTLLGIGIAGMAGYAWRRRRALAKSQAQGC